MSKFLTRIVTLLLVPCLFMDLGAGKVYASLPSVPTVTLGTREIFRTEASQPGFDYNSATSSRLAKPRFIPKSIARSLF